MKVMKHLLILFISIIISSCSTAYKHGENQETTQKSNLTFGVVKSQIIKGETTQQDILKIFGSPNIITKNKSNNEIWSYNKMSVTNRQGASASYSGARASQSSSANSFDLILEFDSNDIVIEYSVVSTKF